MNKTVILFGGSSAERLVSVASAQNVSEHFHFDEILFLDRDSWVFSITQEQLLAHKNPFTSEFRPILPPVAQFLENAIPLLKNKTIFMGFHGTEGEDGKIQVLLEKNKIAFTGSGSVSSQNSFSKSVSKRIVAKANIATTEELVFTTSETETRKSEIFDFFQRHGKIVLKPVANGSSIGLYVIEQKENLEEAIQKIMSADLGDYIAEKFLHGRELTVGVYQSVKGLVALPPSEVIMNQGRSFDYEGKYLGHGSTEITPAQLAPQETAAAQKMAIDAHQALSCYGYSRTDIILTNGGPVFLETNTLPGLSRASFVPQQLNVADIRFTDFVHRQLELAEVRSK